MAVALLFSRPHTKQEVLVSISDNLVSIMAARKVVSSSNASGGDQLVGHRVKECCVHLHNSIQKWKELSTRGFNLANQIVNSTMQYKYTQDTAQYGSLATSIASNLGSKAIANREDLFQQLTAVKDQLLKVVDKMGSLVGNLRSAVDLSLSKGQDPEQPLFTTLPPSMFGIYSEELYLTYSQEMSLRESIIQDLLLQHDRDTLTVYLSCWVHEPYLTTQVTEHLEAMLFECGLRT